MNFPQTPDFLGLNEPVGIEWSERNLEVEGEIPQDIRGAFFRAVADPQFPPLNEDDTTLSSDGMVSRILFKSDGIVDADIRYVHTARYEAEKKAGRRLFGRYRNPFTDDPSVADVDRTVSNTTPVWHAGRLLMTKEDGRAYQVDQHTLDTVGSYDFSGVLRSKTMTAHVRVDPTTQEMFFFGYEADDLASCTVAYCIADRDGALVSEQWFEAPYCSMMHDFVITENYAVFPVFPTTADLERLKNGGDHWIHEPDRSSWIGIMPRYGDVKDMKWIEGPKGVSVYHMMNGFEDAFGRIHIDQCIADTNAFEFIRRPSGIHRPQHQIKGSLIRWTIDPANPRAGIRQKAFGPSGDMPRIAEADQGRNYRTGWYLTVNPEGGAPLIGGPVGACFNMMLRVNPGVGIAEALTLPPDHAISEPVHVPASEPGHPGWLIAMVDRKAGEDSYGHTLWVLNAGHIEREPVARVKVPHRSCAQVHGWWVPQSALDETRE